MSAEEFRADVESGVVPINRHDQVLRIAFMYLDEGLWSGNGGVFDVIDQLHPRGWSFGKDNLISNRTLDTFYTAQIAAGIYRSSDQLDADFPSADDFEAFYAEHRPLLNLGAWREYYSPAFLASPTSARFYRLPNLQDLPDSSDPLGQPRPQKGARHFTKLPRWAYNAMRTRRRQPALPTADMTEIALATLRQITERQRGEHPAVVAPYSETQALFWLGYMKVESLESLGSQPVEAWDPNEFGVHAARGGFDVWAWEAYYSKERWDFADGGPPLEPDLDGARESEVQWCGLPDGGVGCFARCRGWEPEVGSEEEVAFLAAVAARETEGAATSSSNIGFDYSMRSHILLVCCSRLLRRRRGKDVWKI